MGPVSYVHPTFRTPSVAIVIHVLVAMVLSLAGSFAQMALMSTVARLTTYLAGCASLFDTPIPPIFSGTMSRARRGFEAAPRYDLQIFKETVFSIRLLKPLAQKLRFLAVRLFIPTPADCQFISLPSWLFILYFPLRCFRVVSTIAGWLVLAGANRLLPMLGFRARATS